MRRDLLAIEQARTRQDQRPGADRAETAHAQRAFANPVENCGITRRVVATNAPAHEQRIDATGIANAAGGDELQASRGRDRTAALRDQLHHVRRLLVARVIAKPARGAREHFEGSGDIEYLRPRKREHGHAMRQAPMGGGESDRAHGRVVCLQPPASETWDGRQLQPRS